jgi:hypothetical protein
MRLVSDAYVCTGTTVRAQSAYQRTFDNNNQLTLKIWTSQMQWYGDWGQVTMTVDQAKQLMREIRTSNLPGLTAHREAIYQFIRTKGIVNLSKIRFRSYGD